MRRLNGFYAGVNFGGWFSQCDYSEERFDHFIEDKDFEVVRDWGFDHVRIPVDYNLFQNSDGTFIESGFDRIRRAIDLCRENNLNMVLDLHKTMGFSFDEEEQESGLFEDEKYQQLFYDLWRELSIRFAKDSDMLAFELLNEITLPEYMPKWNEIASGAINIIRGYSKDIKILVGGYYNNSPEAIPHIHIPMDENIVFNFHCYEPVVFTHQGAYWIPDMPADFRMEYKTSIGEYREIMKGMLDYQIPQLAEFGADVKPDPGFFKKRFEEAVATAEKYDAYLYCGEYGVIELADLEETEKWYTDIHEAFAEYGIGHALWSYREMDFDFVGDRMDPIRDSIIASSKREL